MALQAQGNAKNFGRRWSGFSPIALEDDRGRPLFHLQEKAEDKAGVWPA
jgi:hypothetical protein